MAGVVVGGAVVVVVANAIVDPVRADVVGPPRDAKPADIAADDEDIIVVAAGVGSVRLRWSIFGRMAWFSALRMN